MVLILLELIASPQNQRPRKVSDTSVKISTGLVSLDVLVENRKTGRAISNLSQSNITIYEDGIKQGIEYVRYDKLPVSLMLLLDVSPSVWHNFKKIKSLAIKIVQSLDPNDKVALMVFSLNSKLILDFTGNHKSAIPHIETIDQYKDSNSQLNTAIGDAAYHLKATPASANRRAVIVISDNKAEPALVADEEYTQRELLESNSVVYGLVIKSDEMQTWGALGKIIPAIGKPSKDYLKPYAAATGGEVINGNDSIEQIEIKLSHLFRRLRARYNIGYMSSNFEKDGKFRKVVVKVSPEIEKREGAVTIRARTGYYAR